MILLGNDNDHSPYFIAHDEAIKSAQRDIASLYKALDGIPQMVKYIKESVDELKDKLDTKVVNKEVCKLCHESQQKQIDEIKESLSKFKYCLLGLAATAAGTVMIELFRLLTK